MCDSYRALLALFILFPLFSTCARPVAPVAVTTRHQIQVACTIGDLRFSKIEEIGVAADYCFAAEGWVGCLGGAGAETGFRVFNLDDRSQYFDTVREPRIFHNGTGGVTVVQMLGGRVEFSRRPTNRFNATWELPPENRWTFARVGFGRSGMEVIEIRSDDRREDRRSRYILTGSLGADRVWQLDETAQGGAILQNNAIAIVDRNVIRWHSLSDARPLGRFSFPANSALCADSCGRSLNDWRNPDVPVALPICDELDFESEERNRYLVVFDENRSSVVSLREDIIWAHIPSISSDLIFRGCDSSTGRAIIALLDPFCNTGARYILTSHRCGEDPLIYAGSVCRSSLFVSFRGSPTIVSSSSEQRDFSRIGDFQEIVGSWVRGNDLHVVVMHLDHRLSHWKLSP